MKKYVEFARSLSKKMIIIAEIGWDHMGDMELAKEMRIVL